MGADHPPDLALEAARQAVRSNPALTIRLIADPDQLPKVSDQPGIELVECRKYIAMDSTPAEALRHGRESSMAVGLREVAAGRADALVSSGNTGALLALARAELGMLPGLERPALITAFPVHQDQVWVLDLGANIGVDADRLVEFAILGEAVAGALLGRVPRVALLNVGRERNKGPDVIREAARRLEALGGSLEFVGFVEGHEVFAHRADVVVCDGFPGNILLKSAEGAIAMLLDELRERRRSWWRPPGLKRLVADLERRYDPQAHNGATLLGVNGIVVKSHGHATLGGLINALGVAVAQIERELVACVERRLWDAV